MPKINPRKVLEHCAQVRDLNDDPGQPSVEERMAQWMVRAVQALWDTKYGAKSEDLYQRIDELLAEVEDE